jgi:hypothetical protein
MAHLESSALSILRAVFGMGLLSLVMMAWMSLTRVRAMQRLGIGLQEAAHTYEMRPRMPSSVRRIADNYNHLLEAPTVFYAVAIAIVVAGFADPVYAGLAWAYLGLRAAHSLVQATFNRVAVRATLYVLSWIVLGAMIVRSLFVH